MIQLDLFIIELILYIPHISYQSLSVYVILLVFSVSWMDSALLRTLEPHLYSSATSSPGNTNVLW